MPADVQRLLANHNAVSQWEGVTSDALGRTFLLEESPGAVYVLSKGFKQLLQVITLDYTPLEADQNFTANSLGEGLVLLKDGHILVLKEKNPQMLIEFGPASEPAVGVSPDNIIEKHEAFALEKGAAVTYTPLKSWTFTKKAQQLMVDFS